MTDERWVEILALIEDKFEITNHETQDLNDGFGTSEIIEFFSPLGKIRLERTDQPLIIDKKVIGSKRIGSDQKVQYVFSDTERVHKFKAYMWDDISKSWREIEMEKNSLFI